MGNQQQIEKLATLFKQTGEAHHEAFAATDGEDPDWAIWYADYLHDRLVPFLAAPITRSRIVFCLVATADEHETAHPVAPWTEFYARRLLEPIGNIPPVEYEQAYYRMAEVPAMAAGLN